MRALILSAAVLLAACGGSSSDTADANAEPGILDQARQAGRAMQGMQQMGEQMQQDADLPPAEPLDFRRLKEMLPETATSFPRTSAEGARQGMGEMNVSNATATYTGPDDARITLTLSDMGGMQGAAMLGAMWTMVTIDRETDTETERTREIGGFPGYETYDSADRSGEMQAIVARRFLVKAEGRGVSAEQLQAAFDAVDLRALDALRDEGRPAK